MIALNFTTSVYKRKILAFTREEDYRRRKSSTTLLRRGGGGQRDVVERNTGERRVAARGMVQGVTGCRGLEITAGQAILSGQEQKDDPPRRITRDAPRCPVKLIREMLFNGNNGELRRRESPANLPRKYSTRFR